MIFKTTINRLLVCTVLFIPLNATAEIKKVDIDTGKSLVKWVGKKVTGQHDGTLKIKSGSVELEGDEIVGGEFVLDMTSISNLDIEDPTWKAKLENHLKSDDFFNVEKFPEGKFKITKINKKSDTDIEINGDLTIKNITKPVVFLSNINKNDTAHSASAKTAINRTEWDIKYNSGKWFDPNQLGDKLIYDEIDIELNLSTK